MKKLFLFMLSGTLLLPLFSNGQCIINAGSAITICSTQGSFPIQGSATGYATYLWSTSGTGTFSTSANLGTVYTPSLADIAAGTVSLSLTGSDGGCSAKTAVSVVTITPAPTVSAGTDQTSCGNVNLNASSANATSITWSTNGSGTFNPNAQTPDAYYVPSNADKSAGIVTLSVTATGNGCTSSPDQTIITFIPPNTVNAGIDLTSCQSNPVSISGSSFSNASGVIWTSSGTGTFSSSTVIHPTYQPSVADITAGSVTLTVTTTVNASCVSATDDLTLTIISTGATVDAGADQSMCGNNVTLKATFSGAGGVIWTTSGTGTFSNTTLANPTYTPSQADRTAGSVVLTATTTSNGSCPSASDQLTVTIDTRVRLIISSDITACPNAPVFPTVSVDAGTVIWTSSGTGTFSSATSLTPVYIPSAADNTAGQYTLTATSSTNGSCPSESGSLQVTLSPLTATANAGADLTICSNTVYLNGSVTNATGGIWTSNGTGAFSPGAHYLHTTYTLSAADLANGSVTLTLTTTGTCGAAVSDAMNVVVAGTSAPVVNAGPDQVMTGTSVTLTGTASGTTSVNWYTTGSGTFSTSTSLSTTYTPSTMDIANGIVELTLIGTQSSSCPGAMDNVLITLGGDFTVSGTISAGSNVLDKGAVFLFKKNTNGIQFITADTILSADAGAYTFHHIPKGAYIILAIPSVNSSYLSSYLPTYSGATQNWDASILVTVTGNISYNVSLSSYISADPNWNSGSDIIAGVIYINQVTSATARVQTNNGTPAPYVTVYLTDASGNKIAYTQTDINGRYAFTNVEAGKYTIEPNYPGANLSGSATSVPVTTDGNASTVEDASMTLEERTTSTTGILGTKTTSLITYPNPAKNSISVNLISGVGTGVIKLLNETGSVQLQQQVDLTTPTVTLNIETLPAGMYILQLIAADEIYTSKVIKY